MSDENKFSDLKTRVISASLFAIAVFLIVWYDGWLPMLLMMVIFVYIGMKEWMDLTAFRNFSKETKRKWFGYGLLYIVWPSIAILLIRYSENFGFVATVWVLSIAIFSDIGAYFAGRFVGGAKVAPSISPNKTWAGVVGGVVSAAILSSVLLLLMGVKVSGSIIQLTIVFSLIGQSGDFFESYVKRKFSVKDTGSFLPGHGGLLDRMDGQIFIMIAAGIFAFFNGPMNNMASSLLF